LAFWREWIVQYPITERRSFTGEFRTMKSQSIVHQKMDIGQLAVFLNIKLGNIDKMNIQEQADLFKQLVALSQMKLTRLALRD
jgi:hypothetical protein